MRPQFAKSLLTQMELNPNIWVLTGDLGYGLFDEIRLHYPERFLNVGVSEQAMLDIGIGLAQAGKIPFCYSITPFLLYRPFEAIRTYVDHEKINIKLVGSGRNKDYKEDGISHWSDDARRIVAHFKNIEAFYPEQTEFIENTIKYIVDSPSPCFLNLRR